ncbi:snakin-2-like [Prosopis cineraria]|uniref:snakin-2-like n=1 Tax=Prosopis cineraria TaxID=364024 RepID=UPI0024103B30|nr:snakin-2-like [Prosopis cineraria]
MASRLLLVLGMMLLMVSLARVSWELEILEGQMEEDEDHHAVAVKDGNRKLMQNIDCGGLCEGRCSVHSRPNLCKRACGTCCVRCKCVPPGTSGNRELCGTCYTDMTTHRNRTKCP